MQRTAPYDWAIDRMRDIEKFNLECACAGISMALDVCEREQQIIDAGQACLYELYEQVDSALEFLATYAKWQEMGNLLNRVQRMRLLQFVYPNDDPQDHHDEYSYSWER